MQAHGWDDGRLMFHELLDASAGFSAFVDGDHSHGLTGRQGLEEARGHLQTFLALETSCAVFVPKDVRWLVGVSLEALEHGQVEIALAALNKASVRFQEHLERERNQDRRQGR